MPSKGKTSWVGVAASQNPSVSYSAADHTTASSTPLEMVSVPTVTLTPRKPTPVPVSASKTRPKASQDVAEVPTADWPSSATLSPGTGTYDPRIPTEAGSRTVSCSTNRPSLLTVPMRTFDGWPRSPWMALGKVTSCTATSAYVNPHEPQCWWRPGFAEPTAAASYRQFRPW